MAAIGTRLEQQYPDSEKGQGVAVVRMRDEMVRDVRVTLYLLLGAVAVVLLIACANISTLLLAKASARTREMAIRAAIGASRARIIRQLISESLVLALVSGAAGILLAYWGSEALVALAPGNVPRLAETGIDAGSARFHAHDLPRIEPAVRSGPRDSCFTRRLKRRLKTRRGAIPSCRRSEPDALAMFSLSPRSHWQSCCSPEPGFCSRAS